MLGIGCPDRHALPRITSSKTFPRRRALPPARAGSFNGATSPLAAVATKDGNPSERSIARHARGWGCTEMGPSETQGPVFTEPIYFVLRAATPMPFPLALRRLRWRDPNTSIGGGWH